MVLFGLVWACLGWFDLVWVGSGLVLACLVWFGLVWAGLNLFGLVCVGLG